MKHKVFLLSNNMGLTNLVEEAIKIDCDIFSESSTLDLIKKINQIKPEIIILDIEGPSDFYIHLCKEIRDSEEHKLAFLIALGSIQENNYIIQLFQNGADDYINIPLQEHELKIRLLSKIRRLKESHKSEITCGNMTINVDQMTVTIDGKVTVLSALEFRLLCYFVQNQNKIISRSKIIAAVWDGTAVSDRTVDTHLVSIRKKIQEFNQELDTVYGAGYILRTQQAITA